LVDRRINAIAGRSRGETAFGALLSGLDLEFSLSSIGFI
jgi:hypothetical protein